MKAKVHVIVMAAVVAVLAVVGVVLRGSDPQQPQKQTNGLRVAPGAHFRQRSLPAPRRPPARPPHLRRHQRA